MRAIFFGTPDAAVPALVALESSVHEVVAVVTAPDRPSGRGMKLSESPIARTARSHGRHLLQPSKLDDNAVQTLSSYGADVFVVVAYGLILPSRVLTLPSRGCINIHFSLLPRLRGAAPVQWALIEGATLTGVTVIQMDEGVDTGPIYAHFEEPIMPDDTAGTLESRLAERGAALLVQVLDEIEAGEATPHHQHHDDATKARKIGVTDARIEWGLDAAAAANRVRAFNPRPGAWTTFRGKRIKLWTVTVVQDKQMGEPGTLDVASNDLLFVDTGADRLSIDELQPESKLRMSAAEFIRGYRPRTGERFE